MAIKTIFSACILAGLVCAVGAASDEKPAPPAPPIWDAFWSSVKVVPPPPENFLDGTFNGRIDNLTGGRISNETARMWVLADLRRGKADGYAGRNLREDIANAGIFGPPGLNGTGGGIQSLREKGVERVEAPGMPGTPDFIAAALISVPKQVQAENPDFGFTDYVIVLLYRVTPGNTTLIYRDGRREVIENKRGGKLAWQLDTGHFFEHPILGPLWYQKNGWSCRPDDTVVGKLCDRVKP